MPAKRTSKVWKSYSLQRFKPIFKVPRYPKKASKLDPKLTLKLKNVRKLRTQKNNKKMTATMEAKGPKLCQNGTPKKVLFGSRKLLKFERRPGIQKASKKCPKGVQKASKLIQIRPHWNQNSKIPIQRTAENHVPYQSFSSEQKSQHMQSSPELASGLLTAFWHASL